jgi:hypothetical protein
MTNNVANSHAAKPDVATIQIAKLWTEDLIAQMLECVWKGYDRLLTAGIEKACLDDEDEINERLWECVDDEVSERQRRLIFRCIPQIIQKSGRKRRRSALPRADLGFALRVQRECRFVAEAKLLHNASHVAKYVAKLRSHFLSGTYAALCPQGMMLGYLYPRTADWAVTEIQKKLGVSLELHPRFQGRDHRRSLHTRNLKRGYLSGEFVCHHLLLYFGNRLSQLSLF